jgi:hypothetical protein
MRKTTKRAIVLTLLVLVALALALGVRWAFSTGAASATNGLACDVKTSCDVGEVEVFRMSATANAHAGTPSGSSYDYVVCCGGVTGLGTNCSGVHHGVLSLSAADNAHVASLGQYPTEVCLSADTVETVDCVYGADCAADYACLATISGTTNAHVADCDGLDDYATKVCCYAGPAPPPVGGIAELADASGSSGLKYIALATLAAAAVIALTAGGWYARRRRLG